MMPALFCPVTDARLPPLEGQRQRRDEDPLARPRDCLPGQGGNGVTPSEPYPPEAPSVPRCLPR